MGQKTQGWLGLLLLFGVLLTVCGITGFTSRTTEYDAPIYISRDFSLSYSGTYTISGQFTNLTDEDVTISEMNIYLHGGTKRQSYYANVTDKNIVIPAHGTYNYTKSGLDYNSDELTSARVTKCYINGTNYSLQYSADGKVFESGSDNVTRSTLMLIGGSILLIIAVGIVINYFVKKKSIKY